MKGDYLYTGKLASSPLARGSGLAKSLIKLAESRARVLGLVGLELSVRIELTENHTIFERLGFIKIKEGSHEGYTRPTYLIMQKIIENA